MHRPARPTARPRGPARALAVGLLGAVALAAGATEAAADAPVPGRPGAAAADAPVPPGRATSPPGAGAPAVAVPADMVAVPAGPFFYGCNERVDPACDPDELPAGRLVLPAFQIDRTEVTVAAYRKCVEAGRCSTASFTGREGCNWGVAGRDRHPINCVELADARAYCAFVGKRVPTEQEWEKAARGTDGRRFAWGNLDFAQAGRVANIADKNAVFPWALADYDDGFVETAPVGSFPAGASPTGAMDMIGNVWEWTDNPYTHQGGTAVRGGSWRSNPFVCRTSNRLWRRPGDTQAFFGFRCAR